MISTFACCPFRAQGRKRLGNLWGHPVEELEGAFEKLSWFVHRFEIEDPRPEERKRLVPGYITHMGEHVSPSNPLSPKI